MRGQEAVRLVEHDELAELAAFMAAGGGIYLGGIEPKLAELLSIAFDASIRHLYAPGIRRHIRAALAEEDGHELIHASVREQKVRRIRHQRG